MPIQPVRKPFGQSGFRIADPPSSIVTAGSPLNTNISYINTATPYFVLSPSATGGSSGQSQNLLVSSLTATQFVDSPLMNSDITNTSTLNVAYVDLDGQVLTANATALLLNGVPIATASNISSLADWSLYPMIQTLDGGGFDMSNISRLYATTVDALTNIRTGSVALTSYNIPILSYETLNVGLAQDNISTSTGAIVSSICVEELVNGDGASFAANPLYLLPPPLGAGVLSATSYSLSNTGTSIAADTGLVAPSFTGLSATISSLQTSTFTTATGNIDFLSTGLIDGSTINANDSLAGRAVYASTLTFADSVGTSPSGQLTINGAGALTFNGSTITVGGEGDVANWSSYKALTLVDMNTQGLSNAGAITATSVACSGNVAGGGSVTGGSLNTTGTAYVGQVNCQGNIGANGSINAAGGIQAGGLMNATNGLNGVGHISLIGNLGDSVILSTDANATGIRFQAGAGFLTTAAALSLNVGGVANFSVGGAVSIAGGGVIELNSGYISCSGGSELHVNNIQAYVSGDNVIFNSPIQANNGIVTTTLGTAFIGTPIPGGSIAFTTPASLTSATMSGNLAVSTITTLSTINGVPVDQFINVVTSTFTTASVSSLTASTINGFAYPQTIPVVSTFTTASVSSLTASTINGFAYPQTIPVVSTFNTASISSLSVSSIVANYVGVNALETASIDKVSTLTASSITTNYINTAAIESASIDKVSTLTASSITSYFGSISTLNISTLNSFPAYKILPNQPTYQIYVAKNGSDTLGTGSIMQPFLTIGKALTTAAAYPDTNIVTILLTPGNYSEAVNVTRNNTFINGLSVNSQEVSITGAVSFTTTTQTIGYIIGGIVGLTINGSLTFSSTAAVPILYTALSGVINGISGTIPLTISQTSITNSFSFTTQGMVISPVDTIGVSVNNTRVSFVQTLITGTTTLVQTTGVGSFTIFGSTLTNTNATATAPPIVKLANTTAVASGAMQINNSYISYTSATVDTGLNKCCVQLSTTTTAAMNMAYNFLQCEGARVTNGSAGQYLCVQNPGTGTITFNYGGNYSGASANHFPNASAKFVKTGYVATT